MLKEAIKKVVENMDLSREEAHAAMNDIMSGEATPAQISCFITALRMKGETVDEIIGCAQVMREKVTPIKTSRDFVVDTCGTGGDGSHTINVSTISAIVAAGAGVPIAKHGNRAVSSTCGSADLLKELGVNLEASPEQVGRCIDEVGIGFMFAPLLHGSMKHAIGPRREIGIRTVFNILGPLTNPAGATKQLLGIYDPNLTGVLADVLMGLGSDAVMVVHGHGGIDELSLSGPSKVAELKDGKITEYEISPEDTGLNKVAVSELTGGDSSQNARITMGILQGEKGPARDVILLNSGAVIMISGLADNLRDGVQIAAETIDSGKAEKKLKDWIEVSNKN